jgi:HEAT repeat protein
VTWTSSQAFLFFVDQLEELFTIVNAEHRENFSHLLKHAAETNWIRIIGTARAGFLSQFASDPVLAGLVQRLGATFPLGFPGPAALVDMIRKPADRAGLILEDAVADEIVKSVGFDAGALPLVAFCLEELYRERGVHQRLTLDSFVRLGGLRGAISRRTDTLLSELRKSHHSDFDADIEKMFSSLAQVDAAGMENRRRALRAELMAMSSPIPELVERLIDGRLLTAEDTGGHAVVMLAHEILLREWPALRDWLDRNRAQLQRVERMMASLSARDAQERQFAIKMLAELAAVSDSVVPALINSLKDQNDDVRVTAVDALGRIGEPAAVAVPELVEIARRGADYWSGLNWADVATNALVRIGSAAVPGLLKIKGQDHFVIDVFRSIGPPAAAALPYLIDCLRHGSDSIQMAAAAALGDIGASSIRVIGELIGSLQNSSHDVRRRAVSSLVNGGRSAASALIEALSQRKEAMTLSRSRDGFEIYAAEALGYIGADAAEGVPCLLAMLNVPDVRVRIEAITALGRIGAVDNEVLKKLISNLGDAYDDVRIVSAEALGRIGQATIPSVMEALEHPRMHVREGAARALGYMGRAASVAVNSLTSLLNDVEPIVQTAAALALGQIKTHVSHFLPSLMSRVGSQNEQVRGSAIIALGRIGPAAAAAVPILCDVLSDEDWTIRGAAAASLGRFGGSAAGAVGALLGRLNDPEERVRAAAAAALGAIGPATTEVVPALLSTFFSAAPGSLRDSAQAALDQIKFVSPELLPTYLSSNVSYLDMKREYEESSHTIFS